MQTFLPYADLRQSASCLDRQRLGKQRVETLQILNTLDYLYQDSKTSNLSPVRGWANHPAVQMYIYSREPFKAHVKFLVLYGSAICLEWRARGYKDTCRKKILAFKDHPLFLSSNEPPKWFGQDIFHETHRCQLLRKDPEHYAQYFSDTIPGKHPYCWGYCSAYYTKAGRSYVKLCDRCFHTNRPKYVSDITKENPINVGKLVACEECLNHYILRSGTSPVPAPKNSVVAS